MYIHLYMQKPIHWRDSFQQMVLGAFDIHNAKYKLQSIPHTIYTTQNRSQNQMYDVKLKLLGENLCDLN